MLGRYTTGPRHASVQRTHVRGGNGTDVPDHFTAGVPGLEPRLTGPEPVGLPITPYPMGSPTISEDHSLQALRSATRTPADLQTALAHPALSHRLGYYDEDRQLHQINHHERPWGIWRGQLLGEVRVRRRR